MNVWKPIALCSVAGLALSIGIHTASADNDDNLCKGQPHMRAALHALKDARGQLDSAEIDKGGWLKNAKDSADAAIKEARRGCGFADTH
jgi:hypothetical protein